MKKKTVALVLLLAALLTSAACQSTSDSDTTALTEQNDAAETTTAAVTDYFNDVLPEEDFGGRSFRFYIRDRDEYIAEMYIEEADGEIINDAVYERNAAVEEKYNTKFELIKAIDNYGRGADTSITAGEDAFDLISAHGRQSFTYAHGKLLLDWMTDMPNVDLSQPWWNQDAINEFTLGGKLYVGAGDISYMEFGSANGMMFNKKLLNNYSLEDPYELVLSDKWTFDKFSEMAKAAIADLNGDSKIVHTDDILGYGTSWWTGPIQVLYSAQQRVCSNINGEMTLTLNTPQTVTAFEKFFTATSDDGLYIYPSADYAEILPAFIEGRSLFADMAIRATSYL
nr:extracellular solute-binding protein [Clostridia bacterium]